MELLTRYIHTWWLGQGSRVKGQSILTYLYLQISGFVSPMVMSLRPCWGMLMWLKPALIFCIYCWKEHVLPFYSAGCCSQAFVQILLFRSQPGDVLAPSVLIYVPSLYWWFCCSLRCAGLWSMCLQLLEAADVNLEEEPRWRKEERREANRAGRGKKGPLSSSFQESWSTETSPLRTHHGPPANHSSSILDPSSFIQLLIHGSLKQMWGDADDGREASDHLYQNISR